MSLAPLASLARRVRQLRHGAFYWAMRRPPTAQELHDPVRRWDDAAGAPPRRVLAHPRLRGLWLVRGCVSTAQADRMKALFSAVHGAGTFPWYDYEPGRDMMPIHASPALDAQTTDRLLIGLEVFGPPGSPGRDPKVGWPRLADLAARNLPGAADLEALQDLPGQFIEAFASERCLFLQAQRLESGAEVTPHRDALPYGGDMIATVVLEGSSDVRVGPVQFQVDTGDLYAIAYEARYDVEHEVFAAAHDRLSVTMRYGLGAPPSLPASSPALWHSQTAVSDPFH